MNTDPKHWLQAFLNWFEAESLKCGVQIRLLLYASFLKFSLTLSEVAILKHDHKGDRKPDSCSGASVELLTKQHE
jgi:hypothetical protein